jgi:NAD(P)-dependent dehydrogenase (short-subunit alcohol dehydrogenase family)
MLGTDIRDSTAIVTGASRGFGRGIAKALSRAGVQVVGVARNDTQLQEVRAELGGSFIPINADAADPAVAAQVIDAYNPRILVLNAGATPVSGPIQLQSWQTFSRNWDVDVQHVFHWAREALLRPLAPGSTVIAMSSAAALRGSPLSGGYAGAKATIRWIASYAAQESQRAGLGIRFVSVLPQLTPATSLGATYVSAYAARQGVDPATFADGLGPALTPELTGKAVTDLLTATGHDQDALLLTAAGLSPLN